MKERISALRTMFSEKGIKAMVVQKDENIRYLSGFSGSSAALYIDSDSVLLLSDFRYREQAGKECPDIEFLLVEKNLLDTLSTLITEKGIAPVGLEAEHISHHYFNEIRDKVAGVALQPVTDMVEQLRTVKDEQEIEKIARACALACTALSEVEEYIRPGVKEYELAARLEYAMRLAGSEGPAFETIIASGQRAAMPHGTASKRVLAQGDFVTMDFGAIWEGYRSDMTRTFVLGKPTSEQERIYNLVLEAQLAGVAAIRPGVSCAEVDKIVRDIITEAGYGEHFRHSTGHGVGLCIHESPRLSEKDDTQLLPGMVVTVEPGIYLPDWGGIRIEDTVAVTPDGCRILTQFSKNLIWKEI